MADGITDRVVALVVKKVRRGVWASPRTCSPATRCARNMPPTAARNGASEASIMRQTGHRSVQMVRRYNREGSLFHDKAGAKLGL